MSDRPVIIIDGLNLFMRHYAAHPAMSKNGDQVGGIVGFLTGIRRLSEKIGPSEIYVIWEGQGSAKKRHLYKEYKKSKKYFLDYVSKVSKLLTSWFTSSNKFYKIGV